MSTAEMADAAFYEYSSLSTPAAFRIAQLLPGGSDEPLRCLLHEVQWSRLREYEALSYAWGDPGQTVPIFVHGKVVQVTRNLGVALLHLRQNQSSRYLWADAICTNQLDIPERGAQVRQMRRIFESATAVLIWLGPDNEARQALLATRAVEQVADFICQTLEISVESLASVEQVYHSILFKNRHRLPPPSDCGFVTNEMWDALLWLYKHPYFTRVWIIQEISANKTRAVLCGYQTMSWDAVELVAGYMVLESLFANSRGFTGSFCWWASTAPSEMHQASNWLHMLYLASNFIATDARDVVYGLRGMIDCPRGGELLDPDYSKTTLQVYRDVVEASLVNYRNTNALLYVSAVDGRPSWIPFWNEAMLFRNPFRFGNHMPWRPAGDSQAVWSVDRERNVLLLTGFSLSAARFAEPYCETIFSGAALATTEDRLEVHSTWRRVLATIRQAQDGKLPLGDDMLTACATSFCHGQDETCRPADEAKLLVNFVAYLEMVLDREEFEENISTATLNGSVSGDGAVFGKPVWDFQYPTSGFFILDDKTMGCCVAPVAPGDIVFVPLGSVYPLVLQPHSDGYRIRGYCFVYGAMFGERLDQSAETMVVQIY